MLISLQHQFVFFCTPKCASNSIEAMLRPYCDIDLQGNPRVRHTTVREYEQFLVPYLHALGEIDRLERIAIMREPVAWLHSWYRFRSRAELRTKGHPNCTAHVDFPGFVGAYLDSPQPPFAEVGSQGDFLGLAENQPHLDRLYSYEHIEDLVAYLSMKIGTRLHLGALNVSPLRVRGSNAMERIHAFKRRVRSWAGVTRRKTVVHRQDPRELLPPDLLKSLRITLAKDFEQYDNVNGRGFVTFT